MDTNRIGAESAVAELYGLTYQRLVGIAALAAGNRADGEECVQEAFIRLLDHWRRVSQYDDPEAWVRAVAFRLLSNRRRKARNGWRALRRHGPTTDQAGPSGDRLDVMAALRLLPLPQRQVVVLHYLAAMTVEEVSVTLEIPVGTVKSRLSRARASLKPLLTEEGSHA